MSECLSICANSYTPLRTCFICRPCKKITVISSLGEEIPLGHHLRRGRDQSDVIGWDQQELPAAHQSPPLDAAALYKQPLTHLHASLKLTQVWISPVKLTKHAYLTGTEISGSSRPHQFWNELVWIVNVSTHLLCTSFKNVCKSALVAVFSFPLPCFTQETNSNVYVSAISHSMWRGFSFLLTFQTLYLDRGRFFNIQDPPHYQSRTPNCSYRWSKLFFTIHFKKSHLKTTWEP